MKRISSRDRSEGCILQTDEVLVEAWLGRDAIDDLVKSGAVREEKGGEA